MRVQPETNSPGAVLWLIAGSLATARTGKQIAWTGAQIDRFEGGKIAETWVNWDKSTMFQQLGLE
jgi:hypothetical protein